MNINCESIVGRLRADFGKLWDCQTKGATLVISTPYVLPNRSVFNVYITTRGNRIVVTDGGVLEDFIDEEIETPQKTAPEIRQYLMAEHGVKLHTASRGSSYFFKATENIDLISSLVFDLGNFAMALLNSVGVLSVGTEEGQEEAGFRAKASEYIVSLVRPQDGRSVKFNSSLPEVKEARFGAVISSSSHVWLVSFITGSQPGYFNRSLHSAHFNFLLASESSIKNRSTLLPLINDSATGYKPAKLSVAVDHIRRVTGREPILWSNRSAMAQNLVMQA